MNHYWGVGVFSMIFCLASINSNIFAESAKIEKGKKVKFDYTLKVEGQVIETTKERGPLEYIHGQDEIIPGLSRQMEGLQIGGKKTIVVNPPEAYGAVNPEAFQEVPKTSFPQDFVPQEGMVIQLQDDQQNALPAVIWEVKEQSVILNFNHPLAGKTLEFDVEIVSIE